MGATAMSGTGGAMGLPSAGHTYGMDSSMMAGMSGAHGGVLGAGAAPMGGLDGSGMEAYRRAMAKAGTKRPSEDADDGQSAGANKKPRPAVRAAGWPSLATTLLL